jgi:hypothetical protein
MPFVSPVTGQTKKSKDGGSGTYYAQWLFALKGGNTQQFWRYDPDGDTWHELDTFPSWSDVTQRRKKVKGGGDITSRGDGALYALKGNKTRELWRFLYGTTDEATPRLRRDGVAAGSRRLSTYCRLTITPNPLTSGFAVLHWNPRILDASPSGALRIFDAAGRCVLTRALHRGQTSDALSPMSVTLDLRGLSSGVYLVRVTDGRRSATCKLVVEH